MAAPQQVDGAGVVALVCGNVRPMLEQPCRGLAVQGFPEAEHLVEERGRPFGVAANARERGGGAHCFGASRRHGHGRGCGEEMLEPSSPLGDVPVGAPQPPERARQPQLQLERFRRRRPPERRAEVVELDVQPPQLSRGVDQAVVFGETCVEGEVLPTQHLLLARVAQPLPRICPHGLQEPIASVVGIGNHDE